MPADGSRHREGTGPGSLEFPLLPPKSSERIDCFCLQQTMTLTSGRRNRQSDDLSGEVLMNDPILLGYRRL